jgi:hypothetical protein
MSQPREDHERAGPAAETPGGGPPAETPAAADALTFDVFAEAVKSQVQDEVVGMENGEERFVLRGYIPADAHLAVIATVAHPLGAARHVPAAVLKQMLAAVDELTLEEIFPEIIRRQEPLYFGCALGVTTESPKPIAEMTDAERRAFASGRLLPDWPAVALWRGRQEVLVLLAGRSRHQAWQAPIIRPHGETPKLGFWATLGHDEPWQRPSVQNLRRALRGEDVAAGASS